MTMFTDTVFLKKTMLASLLGLSMAQSCLALEALDDESLSDATGEGVAFLPENLKMVFQKADDTMFEQEKLATNWTDRSLDTGLIRIIPVGPLSANAGANARKADIFLYGLALSNTMPDGGAGADVNSRFSNRTVSLGEEKNPWVLNVETKTVPNFAGQSTTNNLSYLQLEAPLAATSQLLNYKTMKLGLWGDIFSRNQTVANSNTFNPATGAPSNTTGLEEKLRFQMVANGLFLDGSQMRVFQTLGGATNSGGLSTDYNNTLGLGLILRLNTHYNPDGGEWSDKVLRISTRETTDTVKLQTPAINGTAAANFEASEGVYLYSPNINLVLGSIYQPLIIDSPDGKNLSLEITRIPNQASVYNQIYTDYANIGTLSASSTYKGSTCNVKYCGISEKTYGGTKYQDNTATHSSIGIGKMIFSDNNRTMRADPSSTNSGIVMKGSSGSVNLGSAAIDGLLIQHFKITTTGL